MALNITEESLDNVDEAFRSLYTERDGSYVLTEINGMKSQSDIDALQEALRKEKNDHKEAKERYRPFAEYKADDLSTKLQRLEELEALGIQNGDVEERANKLVDAKLAGVKTPLERQITDLSSERDSLLTKLASFEARETKRSIESQFSKAMNAHKVQDSTSIRSDILMYTTLFELNDSGEAVTKDGVGVTPGLTAEQWLRDQQSVKYHWWGESKGGGARAGKTTAGGPNPFTADNWNVTAQMALVKKDAAEAERLAKKAGTVVGGLKPSK